MVYFFYESAIYSYQDEIIDKILSDDIKLYLVLIVTYCKRRIKFASICIILNPI